MQTSDRIRPRLAFLCSFSGDGGVERVVQLLAEACAAYVDVDLLALKLKGGHAGRFGSGVRLLPLASRHSGTAAGEIAKYLREQRPDVLLVAKDRASRAALRARDLAKVDIPVWLQLHTNLSAALHHRSALSRWLRLRMARRSYHRANGIIAVSEGVRADIVALSGVAPGKVHTIDNPVITDALFAAAAAPSPHEWLDDPSVPVIVGMGRLTRQKDFPTLLRAFARLQTQRPSRLVILGEGGERPALEALRAELGVQDRVLLPGFQANPHAWLSRARLFVLSSQWEGFGLALAEALALGIPSVSTDCPSGPRDILEGGRLGELVSVGEPAALAGAMARALQHPVNAEALQAAMHRYHADVIAQRYLRRLELLPP